LIVTVEVRSSSAEGFEKMLKSGGASGAD